MLKGSLFNQELCLSLSRCLSVSLSIFICVSLSLCLFVSLSLSRWPGLVSYAVGAQSTLCALAAVCVRVRACMRACACARARWGESGWSGVGSANKTKIVKFIACKPRHVEHVVPSLPPSAAPGATPFAACTEQDGIQQGREANSHFAVIAAECIWVKTHARAHCSQRPGLLLRPQPRVS